jgi:predicted enzyme related to lactoylglutathione lyase
MAAVINARYVHTNLIARDWKQLSQFYIDVLGCAVVPPERHYRGADLERGTGIYGSEVHGVHLRLPGCGDEGPTLEIYSYSVSEQGNLPAVNRPGFAHIAFSVPDVEEARRTIIQGGGKPVGEVVTLQTAAGDRVTWCYVRDPEENIVELQSWVKVST